MPELRANLRDEALLIEEITPFIKGVSQYLDKQPEAVKMGNFYHDLRDEQLALYGKLQPHYDYAYKPDIKDTGNPLVKKRPNEPEAIREYRVNMREPVTVSITNKMLTFFGRLFNPRLIKINYSDHDKTSPLVEENEGLREYLSNMPENGDFIQFLKQVQLKNEEVDPNGWVTVRTVKADDELEPEELPEPVFFCVPSEYVINYGNTFLITESSEKSPVQLSKNSETTEQTGYVFFVYTPNFTFKMVQFGAKYDYNFFPIIWNRHYLGYVPAIQNGGQLDKTNKVESLKPANFYYPFLMAAIPHLSVYDELYNNQQAAYIVRIFLERYEKRIDCKQCGGTGMYKPRGLHAANAKMETCSTCNGAGTVRSKGLFDTWKLTVPEGEEAKSPAGYVSLPVDIIEQIEKKLERVEFQALSAVNMESLNQSQASSTSGVSKMQDRDALYTLLENKAYNLFARTGTFLAKTVNGIRYGTILGEDLHLNNPYIQGPQNFNIIGVNEIIEIAQKVSGISGSKELLKKFLIDIAKQQFGMNSNEAKVVQTELELIPFALHSEDEILTAGSMGVKPDKKDVVKYLYREKIIEEALNLYPNFLDMPYDEKTAIFDEIAERLLSELPEEVVREVPEVFV